MLALLIIGSSLCVGALIGALLSHLFPLNSEY